MEVTLKFDTSNPEQDQELKRMMAAGDMASVLWEMTYNVRKQVLQEIQYKDSLPDDDKLSQMDGIDKLMSRFNELMREHNIDIDNLNN